MFLLWKSIIIHEREKGFAGENQAKREKEFSIENMSWNSLLAW